MKDEGHSRRELLILGLIVLAGLALRLVVWRWREFQALGGDEQEYFDQALTLLRERQYVELRLMRPPLYTLFLAASILAVDSLVQSLRLVQALISAATVPLVYLLTLEIARGSAPSPPRSGAEERARRAGLVAAALCALSYTLAANATELLTETLFLFGLTGALWLLLRAGRLGSAWLALGAGLAVGALCLVRSVGLPLLPLGALWLLFSKVSADERALSRRARPHPRLAALGTPSPLQGRGGRGVRAGAPDDRVPTNFALSAERRAQSAKRPVLLAVAFACAALLVIGPWTVRNYLTYGGLILIDTTGAENLWLDNDPAGREAVKAQLYAMGEERLARQQLASRQGVAVILDDPGRFASKAWGELLKFFALEQADDMRARPAIWVSPAETWARLLLGDALWLLILLAGSYALALSLRLRPVPGWVLGLWALYVLLTTLIFHVELRYRLPLYPALLPYAAIVLAGGRRQAAGSRSAPLLALIVPAVCLALTLLHTPYPILAWQLGWKHWQLGRAEAALARADLPAARRAADAALARDEGSALARIALARAALLEGDLPGALALLDAAVAAIPDHPQAHVLRGDVLRATGDREGAGEDLAFEPATRQDLQAWLWERAATPAAPRLELGDGLDLGFVRGLHPLALGDQGFRWTRGRAELRLAAPAGAGELALRLASGRPAGTAPVPVEVWAGGERLGTVQARPEWGEATLPLPTVAAGGELIIELRAPTFTPRAFDRASPDGRALGMKVDWAVVQ